MGLFTFLHRRFGSLEHAVEDEKLKGDDLRRIWTEYVTTIPAKRELINKISAGGWSASDQKRADLLRLQEMLEQEFENIRIDVDDEESLLADLGKVRYAHELKLARHLHEKLAGTEADARALFHLLENLYELVKSELNLVRLLRGKARQQAPILHHLLEHIRSESVVVARIQRILDEEPRERQTKMFLALVRGAELVRKLNEKEAVMMRALETHYWKDDRPSDGETKRWIDGVLERLQQAIFEAIEGNLVPHDRYANLQFVNDDALLSELAIEVLRTIRASRFMQGVDMHHPLVKAFVESFRQAYNRENLFY